LPTTSPNKPGCLAGLLSLIGITPKKPSIPYEDDPADFFPYRVRDDFLSPAEHSFYLVLKQMMGEYFTICPKVSLADIFFVYRPNENMSAYNRINRKHVDFLICEPNTMRPRFAIELDDRSHQRPEREARDDFVDGVFEEARLALVHVPVQMGYNTAELGGLFKQALQRWGNPGGQGKYAGRENRAGRGCEEESSAASPILPEVRRAYGFKDRQEWQSGRAAVLRLPELPEVPRAGGVYRLMHAAQWQPQIFANSRG
jgi:hypothetical protein